MSLLKFKKILDIIKNKEQNESNESNESNSETNSETDETENNETNNEPQTLSVRQYTRPDETKPRFDKRAYMREYMRRRNAQIREQLANSNKRSNNDKILIRYLKECEEVLIELLNTFYERIPPLDKKKLEQITDPLESLDLKIELARKMIPQLQMYLYN